MIEWKDKVILIQKRRNKICIQIIKQVEGLDFSKISNRNTKIVSSEEALKDVKPIEWSEDVLNGKRKVTIKKQ